MATFEQYLDALRYALNHLYDPNIQRTSPLTGILGLSGMPHAGLVLQQALIEGIESLKVQADASVHSPLRRTYEVLLFRYVQQWSQQEVADQLGISPRHLRREQQAALELLAQRLCERHRVTLAPLTDGSHEESLAREVGNSAIQEELAWLEGTPPDAALTLEDILPGVLSLAQPMAQEYGVCLLADVAPASPVIMHPSALRQLLLSLLAMGLRHARGGRVVVSARPAGWGVSISVSAPDSPSGELSPDDQVSLDVIRHLLHTCRGRLDPPAARGCFSVGIVLPASEQVPILAIDDNKDTLALIQRFLTGTCYRFWGSTTLDEALAIARQTPPKIILIDVMMPAIDGWETMGRLRQHPLTCSVPIIVCSILAEEELALSLGARAYIRKPFSRETLLQILDRQRVP